MIKNEMTQNEMTQVADFLGMEVLSPLQEVIVSGGLREHGIVSNNSTTVLL